MTVISTYPQKKKVENYYVIDVSSMLEEFNKMPNEVKEENKEQKFDVCFIEIVTHVHCILITSTEYIIS